LWARGQSYEELEKNVNRLFEEGKYAEAIPVAIKVKDLVKGQFGDTTATYATSLNTLAQLYSRINSYALAEPLYKQALDIRKKYWGKTTRNMQPASTISHHFIIKPAIMRLPNLFINSL
jgi:tetratricopeptide (TPR) repeat protein